MSEQEEGASPNPVRGRVRDVISRNLVMSMRSGNDDNWTSGYLEGFEGAIAVVDFLVMVATAAGDHLDGDAVLAQLRGELAELESQAK